MCPAPIDLVNWIGRKKALRPLGLLVSNYLTSKSLPEIVASSGRRIGAPIFGAYQASLSGTSVKQNMTDGRIMFESIEKFVTTYKPDLVMCTMAELTAEAEACGSKIKMPEDALPYVVEHLPIKTIEDIKKLRIPDPSTDGRLPVFIEATALFKKRFALPQFAIATGPFTLASELIGTDIIARKVFKDPPLVHALMQFSLKVLQRYSHALFEAGADLIGLGDPSCSLVSAKAFAEFILPYHQQYVKEMPVPVTLHVCGQATHLVELLCETGTAGMSLDTPTDVTKLKDRVPVNTMIFGNLSPVEVLMMKKPAEVRASTHALMQDMEDFPNFAVMSGCDLPIDTPIENVGAMIKAIKEFKPN
jgi:uroporphyrinogen decarboxylase